MKFIYLTTALLALGAQSVEVKAEEDSWNCPDLSHMEPKQFSSGTQKNKYYIEAKTGQDTWTMEEVSFDAEPTFDPENYADGLEMTNCSKEKSGNLCVIKGCKYKMTLKGKPATFTLVPTKLKEREEQLGYKCMGREEEQFIEKISCVDVDQNKKIR